MGLCLPSSTHISHQAMSLGLYCLWQLSSRRRCTTRAIHLSAVQLPVGQEVLKDE
ncbi:hypothetical protein J6590_025152 [Homalodisca vitripennis]|nr:hypothetical protein J6590_025152 [Homalodisca vitripennis]